MKKRILLTIFSFIFVLTAFAACGGDLSYSYINPPVNDKEWNDLEPDTGMTVDGKFDESQYSGKTEFSFSPEEHPYKMTLSNYFGDKGVYFKVVVEDDGVYYNNASPIFENTSVIIYVSPFVGGEVPTLGVNTIQLRVAANGNNEQWMGRRSEDGYKYVRVHIDNMSRTQIIQNDGSLTAPARKSEVNYSDVKGYQVELFMPYDAIGLEGKPAQLMVAPEFNKRMTFSEKGRVTFMPKGVAFDNPATFLGFDANGYRAVLNKGANMYGNLGYDLTKDTAEDTRSIEQKGAGDQKLYFNDLNSTKYMIESEITVKNGSLNNDNFPKFGLLAAENDSNTYAFFVDPSKALTGKDVLAVGRTDDDKDWTWGNGFIKNVPTMTYKDGNTVKLRVIRDGAKFYFFVDGAFVGVRENIRGFDATTPSKAGFMTMNFNAEYTNYSATTDTAKIDAELDGTYTELVMPTKVVYSLNEELDLTGGKIIVKKVKDSAVVSETLMTADGVVVSGYDKTKTGTHDITATANGKTVSFSVYIPKIAFDGNLADWTENMKRNPLAVTEENGTRGFKVYAFYDSDGLYLGVTAKHKTNPNDKGNWWENTNFEFFINGDNQRFINNKGDRHNGLRTATSTMKVEGTADNYTTTAEIYIPMTDIPGYGLDADYVRVGFAFKVAGEAIKIPNRDGGNATDWWWEDKHFPNNAGEQYYVKADGIHKAA